MEKPQPNPGLILAASKGDQRAKHRLLEQWAPVVLGWCTWLDDGRIDPEDAAHDVLVTVLTSIGSLRNPEAFQAWLFVTTKRVVGRHRRKLWLRSCFSVLEENEYRDPSPDGDAERHQARREVHQILGKLPDDLRQVMLLCIIEERSSSEAAAILHVPVGTVKSRLRRARSRLQRRLGRDKAIMGDPASALSSANGQE